VLESSLHKIHGREAPFCAKPARRKQTVIVRVSNVSHAALQPVTVRCPGCGNNGTFQAMAGEDFRVNADTAIGLRRCPNTRCSTLLFVIERTNDLTTYPPLRIDFDHSEIPPNITVALEEAITCHANQCYTAAAMMIRKTFELLCEAQNATGNNLKLRIAALRNLVILPPALMEGVDDLRLLGNDAAHIESREFDNVGQAEVETAITFTKEVLKGIYQYTRLLNELRALKRPTP
jgi:hypothetical protein